MGKKKNKLPIKSNKKLSYSAQLLEKFRERRAPANHVYNYHSKAFKYFHAKAGDAINPSNIYRKKFWSKIADGSYDEDNSLQYLKDYKVYLEQEFQKIIENYSLMYWLHVSRRIAPGTTGQNNQKETILICRNIITAAIQKYAQLNSCDNIGMSDELAYEAIFNGLFLHPDFIDELEKFKKAPAQIVLTNFDKNSLVEYYQLEKIAYEMWLIGAKSRTIAKGARLIVKKDTEQILLDDRSSELAWLIQNFDKRSASMFSSATGTVFKLPEKNQKYVLLPELFCDRSAEKYNDEIVEKLGVEFAKGHFPNFHLVGFYFVSYIKQHEIFVNDFEEKWNVNFQSIMVVIASLCLSLMGDIASGDVNILLNVMSRGYRIFKLEEFRSYICNNWQQIVEHLELDLRYDAKQIDASISFLTLTEVSRKQIFVDSFGPLKVFLPHLNSEERIIDYSVIGDMLFNLFSGLALGDKKYKGVLLEQAIANNPSYLPTSGSKGFDGSAKQVDYSVVVGNVLVLAECKAVASSFGVFTGQASAIQHRLRNVIHKGLDDVDTKVQWFIKHKKGKNYDISGFKYIVGVAISPFVEFMPSKEDRYWLNENLPRVLTIEEFETLIKSDIEATVTKNLINIPT